MKYGPIDPGVIIPGGRKDRPLRAMPHIDAGLAVIDRSRIIPVLCTLLVATFLFGTVSATNISMIGNTVTEPPLTQEELEHISECNALIEQQLARDNLTRAIDPAGAYS